MGLEIWLWKSIGDRLETALTQTQKVRQKCVPSYFGTRPTKSETEVSFSNQSS